MQVFRVTIAVILLTSAALVMGIPQTYAQGRPVIPPGHEATIQQTLTPSDDQVLPGGARLDAIDIHPHHIRLVFKLADGSQSDVTVGKADDTALEGDCRTAGMLRICGVEADEALMEAYAASLVAKKMDEKAASVWSAEAVKKQVDPPPEPPTVEKTQVVDTVWGEKAKTFALFLAWGLLMLAALSPRRWPSVDTLVRWLAAYCASSVAFWIAFSSIEITGMHWLFVGWTAVWFLMLWRRWSPEMTDLVQSAYGRLRESGHLMMLIAILVAMGLMAAFGGLLNAVGLLASFEVVVSPACEWISGSLNLLRLLLPLTTMAVAAYLGYKNSDALKSYSAAALIGGGLGFGFALASVVDWYSLPADLVWPDYQAAVNYMTDFATPLSFYWHNGVMHGLFGGLLFKVTGFTPQGIHLLHALSIGALTAALAVLSRSLYGCILAAGLTALLFCLQPDWPLLVMRGWWLFGGASLVVLALAARLKAARNGSELLMLLAILLAQCAIEYRREALVLFPLFAFISVWRGSAPLRFDRLAAALFVFNLIRLVLTPGSGGEFGLAELATNGRLYGEWLGEKSWLFSAAAIGLFVARKHWKAGILLVPVWLAGTFALYQLAYTVPSRVEAAVVGLPLFVLSGAIATIWREREGKQFKLLRVGIVLAISIALAIHGNSRRAAENAGLERTSAMSSQIVSAAALLSEATTVIIDPLFAMAMLPGRFAPPADMPACIDPDTLPPDMEGLDSISKFAKQYQTSIAPRKFLNWIAAQPELVCFDDMTSQQDQCCFWENEAVDILQTRRDERYDKYVGTHCWPASVIGRPIAEKRAIGSIRMIRFENP